MRKIVALSLLALLHGLWMPDSMALSWEDQQFQKLWDSYWLQPIPKRARYQKFNVPGDPSPGVHASYHLFDINFHVLTDNTMPEVDLYSPAAWNDRDSGTFLLGKVILPVNFVVPDATSGSTPNYPTMLYNKDSKQATMLNGIARPQAGGPIWGYRLAPKQATHGGSAMTGGEITLSELQDQNIRHALAILVFAKKYLSRQNGGFVSPATKADSGYDEPDSGNYYNGPIPNLGMGTRLAIPQNASASKLGISTPMGLVLFAALKNYGAYIVDNSAWDATYINITPDARSALVGVEKDLPKLFAALEIVQ